MFYRNNNKGHMDKNKGDGWKEGRDMGKPGVGGKGRKLYLIKNKNQKYLIKKTT